MSVEILWPPGVEEALRHLDHWKTAAAICAGVVRFAETGEGQITPFGRAHHLHVAGYIVRIQIDRAAETITVLRFFRDGTR